MTSARRAKGGLSLKQILFFAPLVLEVLNLIRQNQKKKQGRFHKARKREKVFDFALDQANRYFGKKKGEKRGWF